MNLPTCPTCGATGKRCKRPSEHEAAEWHVEREDALAAQFPNCPGCAAWLQLRAQGVTPSPLHPIPYHDKEQHVAGA